MSEDTRLALASQGFTPPALFPGQSLAIAPVQAPMLMWAGAFTAVYIACGVAIAMMYAGSQTSRF